MYEDNKAPGTWEVVGGKTSSKSKGKSASGKSNGSGGKSGGHVPIIKVDELVTPLDTKYALLDPQLRSQAKRDALGLPAEKPTQKNKAKPTTNATKDVVKKKPSKEPVKEKPPKSLPEALKQINVAELSTAMTTVKARFAGSRLLWLKELATYLNNNMNVESDPVFSGKPRDYPANSLSPDLKNIITSTISSCEEEVLNAFYDQVLLTLPSEMNRGVAVVGTKIVLQLLSYHKPDIVLGHLERAREILKANESRVPVALSILWILSQSSFKDTRTGIQVWMECMLPMIGLKNYGGYVAQNAEFLTTKASNSKLPMNFLSVPDYFKFVEYIQQGTSIPNSHRKEVTNLVEAITQPIISANGSKMFTQYMRRLAAEPASGRAEICKNMAQCLRSDARAYEIWRKDYNRSNLVASSYLLKWVADNDPKFARQSPDFQSTLQHFQTINSTFSPTAKVPAGLNSCVQACVLLKATAKPTKKRSGSKLKYINYLLLVALVSLVYYDIRVFGDGKFASSRLGKAAESSGLTAKVLELHQHAEPYLGRAEAKFIQLRDIAYVKGGELHQRAQPYLNQAGEGLVQLRDTIYRKGEELYPGIWAETDKKYQAALLFTQEKSATCYSKTVEYAELGMEMGAQYWEKFVDWSAVYRKQVAVQAEKAMELSRVYFQQARQITIELVEKEQVQYAIKYSYDMYHKALHAIGICSH